MNTIQRQMLLVPGQSGQWNHDATARLETLLAKPFQGAKEPSMLAIEDKKDDRKEKKPKKGKSSSPSSSDSSSSSSETKQRKVEERPRFIQVIEQLEMTEKKLKARTADFEGIFCALSHTQEDLDQANEKVRVLEAENQQLRRLLGESDDGEEMMNSD